MVKHWWSGAVYADSNGDGIEGKVLVFAFGGSDWKFGGPITESSNFGE